MLYEFVLINSSIQASYECLCNYVILFIIKMSLKVSARDTHEFGDFEKNSTYRSGIRINDNLIKAPTDSIIVSTIYIYSIVVSLFFIN